MSLKEHIGLLKSKFIYDYKPFNSLRLKRFYKQFVTEGDLCFDIGAHTGNRTKTWLSLHCRVVAVEPSSFFARHLQKRFSKNISFFLEQKAVSDISGKAFLKVSSVYPTVSTLSQQWSNTVNTVLKKEVYDAQEEVEMITIQHLINKYGMPDFCKIDVEGFESQVLQGLKSPLKSLSFEFYSDHKQSAYSCIDLLGDLGNYEFNWSLSESLVLQENTWVNANFMKYKLENLNVLNSGDIYARLIK